MIEVNEGVVDPKFCAELLARDHFARIFEQHEEDLEGLLAHLHAYAEFAQLARASVEGVGTERSAVCGARIHVRKPWKCAGNAMAEL